MYVPYVPCSCFGERVKIITSWQLVALVVYYIGFIDFIGRFMLDILLYHDVNYCIC